MVQMYLLVNVRPAWEATIRKGNSRQRDVSEYSRNYFNSLFIHELSAFVAHITQIKV